MSDVLKEILKEKTRVRQTGKQPTKIAIPIEKEDELELLASSFGSEIASDAVVHGIREALKRRGNKLWGMDIQWDAPKLRVE